MEHPFLRNEMLWGPEAQARLARAHVLLLGLGGVGSYAAECLARSGVGELTLVDSDTIALTNLNRQLEALHSTLGQPKAEAVAARLRDINPDAELHPVHGLYDAAHRDCFFPEGCRYDYIVDAIDLVSCKLDLAETALKLNIPLIAALGTGNKLDPTLLQVTDISKTYGCPLARVMRKELRTRGIHHLKVVFSPEKPVSPAQPEAPPPGRRSVPASNPWVPATAGLLLGSAVVRDLIARSLCPDKKQRPAVCGPLLYGKRSLYRICLLHRNRHRHRILAPKLSGIGNCDAVPLFKTPLIHILAKVENLISPIVSKQNQEIPHTVHHTIDRCAVLFLPVVAGVRLFRAAGRQRQQYQRRQDSCEQSSHVCSILFLVILYSGATADRHACPHRLYIHIDRSGRQKVAGIRRLL